MTGHQRSLPDGRLLATGTLGAGQELIAIRNSAGRVQKRIRHSVGIEDLAWGGPRGLLAFNDNERILLVRPAGGARRLYRRTGGNSVAFSRQGRLAWTGGREGLWVTDRSRTRVRRLRVVAAHPAWSPDATHLAYRFGEDVMSIKADGSDRRLITKRCNDFEGHVTWSPDGREIACGARTGDLLAVRLATGRTRAIARSAFPDDIDWQRRRRR